MERPSIRICICMIRLTLGLSCHEVRTRRQHLGGSIKNLALPPHSLANKFQKVQNELMIHLTMPRTRSHSFRTDSQCEGANKFPFLVCKAGSALSELVRHLHSFTTLAQPYTNAQPTGCQSDLLLIGWMVGRISARSMDGWSEILNLESCFWMLFVTFGSQNSLTRPATRVGDASRRTKHASALRTMIQSVNRSVTNSFDCTIG